MARGTNIEQTRAYNRRAILQTLHRSGVASRTEIARSTSLSLQAVSNIIQELEDEGLVVAKGRRATERGQPPIEYALNPKGAFSIGLSIDSDHIAGLLVDASGASITGRRYEADTRDPQVTLARLAGLVGELQDALPGKEVSRLIGVALGVPGVVAEEGGKIARMVRLVHWEGLRVRDMLSSATGTPVTVANDAVLAALGERWFGVARDADTFFYVLFALGLGSSLVLGGEPYGGPWEHRGRLGHIPVEPGGRPCPSCGGSGCLSLYTSLGALHDHLAQHGIEARDQQSLEDLHGMRHPALLEWIGTAAHYLARALVVLENILAPDVIVFGGRMPRPILSQLSSEADELYRRQRPPLRPTGTRLLLGRDDVDAVTLGAATLPHYLTTAASYRLLHHS